MPKLILSRVRVVALHQPIKRVIANFLLYFYQIFLLIQASWIVAHCIEISLIYRHHRLIAVNLSLLVLIFGSESGHFMVNCL